MGSLKQAELVERSFIRVGSKLYGFADAIHLLTIHTFAQLAAYSIILFALILIWRKKKIGFLFYVFGNVAVILSTLFILGTKYFSLEITYTDLALIGSSTLYFGIGAVWMYRSKLKVENKTTED
ncbi:MAG: hypothetical protein R2780_06695 [Crocinitomicaceae bacterium]|nr:hypothetical protein [Crocinitomicaceae bacterium]